MARIADQSMHSDSNAAKEIKSRRTCFENFSFGNRGAHAQANSEPFDPLADILQTSLIRKA